MSASHAPHGVPLPTWEKDPQELNYAIQRMVRAGLQESFRHLSEWLTNDSYLRGIRGSTYNFLAGGNVEVTYEDESGALQFRLEYALVKYQTEKGRLLGIDTAPRSTPKGFGLNAVRSSSMSQAILDHLITEQMVTAAKTHMIPLLLKTGMVGIAGWVSKQGEKVYGHLEVIHPRELLSIPSRIESNSDLIGLIRRRTVPLEWAKKQPLLKETLTKMHKDDFLSKLGATYQDWGYVPEMSATPTSAESAFLEADHEVNSWSGNDGSTSPNKNNHRKGALYIRLNEVYLLGADRTVARYIAHAGQTVINDLDYVKQELRYPMPIGIIRYNDIGELYGRSFLYPLVTLNRELEETYAIFMDQLQDDNALGMTFLPSTMGITDRQLKQTTKPRIVMYEPTWDAGTHETKPFHIKPTDLTQFPINIAQVITEMMNLQSGQSAIYQGAAPGRVDSAASIAALTEAGNTGLSGPLESISEGFAQAYASILFQAQDSLKAGDAISMRSLDPRILGIVSDPETGTLTLEGDSPIPAWDEINIGIESKHPRSRGQRMAELTEALANGTITLTDYRIIARRENLELPLASDGEWETYRMTMMNIRTLFGDGETPGKALIRPFIDTISVAVEYLTAFMKSPEFSLASKAVKDAFWDNFQLYTNAQGTFPAQLPDPSQMAEGAQQQQAAAPPAQQPGGLQ